MGGCRCTFRNCSKNSSNSPGTHFFHFPFKDPERCKKWAEYSNNLHYMQLEIPKLRNKVVCEMHFRDENFMNYKKERLIQQAVPTLVRLDDGTVLDYEEGENPVPKFLNPTNLQHLVPPPSKQGRFETPKEPLEKRFKELRGPSPAKLARIARPPRILNVSAPENTQSLPRLYTPVIHRMSSEEETHTISLESIDKEVTEIDFESVIDDVSDEPIEEASEASQEVIIKDDDKELEILKEIEELNMQLASKDAELESLRDELQNLRSQVALQQAKPIVSVTQVETITTSRKSENAVAAPLTKAQLFNGIKKYLGPSMAAMVRMDMFGGPERDWKPDEKNVAVELLSLGEHVFDYVRDEWRCRLPPKREVEQWLSQRGQLDDEEDL